MSVILVLFSMAPIILKLFWNNLPRPNVCTGSTEGTFVFSLHDVDSYSQDTSLEETQIGSE